MRKNRNFVIALVCLALVAGFIALHGRGKDPSYHGRSLSKWLITYYERDRPHDDHGEALLAAAAIRAIGTNAVPLLLDWIRNETTPWHRTVARALPARLGNSRVARATVFRGFLRAEAAQQGFWLLGTNAANAIPELRTMMNDNTHLERASRATFALVYLGPQAFEVLAARLADTNQPDREDIALIIGRYTAASVGTNTCLGPLRAAVNDPDPNVRAAASGMVLRLTASQTARSPAQ